MFEFYGFYATAFSPKKGFTVFQDKIEIFLFKFLMMYMKMIMKYCTDRFLIEICSFRNLTVGLIKNFDQIDYFHSSEILDRSKSLNPKSLNL